MKESYSERMYKLKQKTIEDKNKKAIAKLAKVKRDALREVVNLPKRPYANKRSAYSEIVDEKICAQLIEGMTLKQICTQPDWPITVGTIMSWVEHPDEVERPGFTARFLEASRIGLIVLGNGILDIADGTKNEKVTITRTDAAGNVTTQIQADPDAIPRAKLQIETRFKILSKLQAETWGERKTIDKTVTVNYSSRLEGARKRLQELEAERNTITAAPGSVIITPDNSQAADE